MRALIALAVLALAACDVTVDTGPGPAAPAPVVLPPATPDRIQTPDQAARNFVEAVQRVEPVAERECLRLTVQTNCDFRIVVDDRPGVPANAFQTVDPSGRPMLVFTLALIADARNVHEIAFVMGHEAAHHIAGHLNRQQQTAMAGAVILGGLATLSGAAPGNVRVAREVGAAVGARRYSKDFELEADRLGTVIAYRAGFDPAAGARFFTRIPDPGDRFLGTHPPNADRYATVLATLSGLR